MRNTTATFRHAGFLLLLYFLIIPGTVGAYVHPFHEKMPHYRIAVVQADTVPENDLPKKKTRYQQRRNATIVCAISGTLNLGLGFFMLALGMKSTFALTMILGTAFGAGILFIGGIFLILALVFGIQARKRMQE